MQHDKKQGILPNNKYYDGKLELVMSVHIDNVFIEERPETLEK